MKATVITQNGKRELTISDCWFKKGKRKDQVTTEQFIKIVTEWDGKDLVKLFSILVDMDYKVLYNSHDFVLEEALVLATKFIYEENIDLKKLKVPETLTIEGKTIPVSLKIGSLSTGQNIHVRQKLDECKAYEQAIANACAVFLQPAYDGTEFNYYRAMELEQKILKLPIVETYALGFFLLKPLIKSGGIFTKELSQVKALLLNLYMKGVAV